MSKDWIMYTGREGVTMLDRAIEAHYWVQWAQWLKNDGIVTEQEYENLVKMINSDDRENFVLAQELIQIKQPNQKCLSNSQKKDTSTKALILKRRSRGSVSLPL